MHRTKWVAAAITGLLLGCTETVVEVIPVATINIDGLPSVLLPGASAQLTARVLGPAGQVLSNRSVSYTSSNTSVATVSANGLVTAVAPGQFSITAAAEGGSGTANLTVNYPQPTVTSVQPNPINAGTATTITVRGTNFFPASEVRVNGVSKAKTFVSASELRATIAAGDFPNATTAQVTVFNPAPGGGSSTSLSLTFANPGFSVTVTNLLIHPATIEANGVVFATVPAATTQTFTRPAVSSFILSWDLVRPVTVGATPIPLGEEMGGEFSAVANPTGTLTYVIDNEFATSTYFAPLITNSTNVGLLMVVNQGLTAEVRCNCVAPVNSTRVQIGYYRLFSNTNVRAYRAGSNYTGGFIFWNFGQQFSSVTTGSGTIELPSGTVAPADVEIFGKVAPSALEQILRRTVDDGRQDYARTRR